MSDSVAARNGVAEFKQSAGTFVEWFFSCGGLGILAAAVAAGADKGGAFGILRVFGLALLLSGASFIGGWLIGLLFGIPKSVATSTAPSAPAAVATPRAMKVNTNLEDISDWLTKLLVGVSLTQVNTFLPFIWHAADRLNTNGFQWPPYGQMLALSLLLYFAPGGFWLSYLFTRTVLTKAMEAIESAVYPSEADFAAASASLRLAPDNTIAPAPEAAEADKKLLALSPARMNTAKELAAWGAAKARRGDLKAAQAALELAVNAAPADPIFRAKLSLLNEAAPSTPPPASQQSTAPTPSQQASEPGNQNVASTESNRSSEG